MSETEKGESDACCSVQGISASRSAPELDINRLTRSVPSLLAVVVQVNGTYTQVEKKYISWTPVALHKIRRGTSSQR